MTTVVALGGNALVRRGELLDPAVQDRNIATAMAALDAAIDADEPLVITHGNGPQVGLLALADAGRPGDAPFPLDVLDAETEGMIGYLLVRHLYRWGGRQAVCLLTQVVVDPADPAFDHPTKPIGPIYGREEAQGMATRRHWHVAPERGASGPATWRRVVASPRPQQIVEIDAIRTLLAAGQTVVCGGGGGVPVAPRDGRLVGVEAVVDKDATSALVAELLDADRFVLLTDVDAVVEGWGTPEARPIRESTPGDLATLRLAAGSIGPKVEAACRFVRATGRSASIGSLDQVGAVLAGRAGTRIVPAPDRWSETVQPVNGPVG